MPCATVSVTVTVPEPASTSAIWMRLPKAALRVSEPSSSTLWAPGTLLTGASFTPLTVTLILSLSLVARPVPVATTTPNISVAEIVIVAAPA